MKYLSMLIIGLFLCTNLSAQSTLTIDLTTGLVISNVESIAPVDQAKQEAFCWSKMKSFFSKDTIPAKTDSNSLTVDGHTFKVTYVAGRYTLLVNSIEIVSGTTVAAMRTTAAVEAYKLKFGKNPI